MIHLRPAMRAKLYLCMCEALEVTDTPNSSEEAQRLALVQLVSNHSGDDGTYSLPEVFRLADALDYWLTDYGGEGPHSFLLANIAALVGGDKEIARMALRLLGAGPTYALEGDDWATDPKGGASIRFPRDTLIDQIRAELDEAEKFAI
jgi:hypothetical protein